jgi:hypothetical protein
VRVVELLWHQRRLVGVDGLSIGAETAPEDRLVEPELQRGRPRREADVEEPRRAHAVREPLLELAEREDEEHRHREQQEDEDDERRLAHRAAPEPEQQEEQHQRAREERTDGGPGDGEHGGDGHQQRDHDEQDVHEARRARAVLEAAPRRQAAMDEERDGHRNPDLHERREVVPVDERARDAPGLELAEEEDRVAEGIAGEEPVDGLGARHRDDRAGQEPARPPPPGHGDDGVEQGQVQADPPHLAQRPARLPGDRAPAPRAEGLAVRGGRRGEKAPEKRREGHDLDHGEQPERGQEEQRPAQRPVRTHPPDEEQAGQDRAEGEDEVPGPQRLEPGRDEVGIRVLAVEAGDGAEAQRSDHEQEQHHPEDHPVEDVRRLPLRPARLRQAHHGRHLLRTALTISPTNGRGSSRTKV